MDSAISEFVRHPRKDQWTDHFKRGAARIIGASPTGRTTVWLLDLNSAARLRLREMLLRLGMLE